MGVSVKAKGLKHLAKLARSLKNPEQALAKASEIGAETTLNLISKGFKAGSDPYGGAWDAPNNLQITGGIRSYTKGQANSKGWTVHSTDKKAIWHHAPRPREAWNGKALPTRQQVPTTAKGLPPKWRKRMTRAFSEALAHEIRKQL